MIARLKNLFGIKYAITSRSASVVVILVALMQTAGTSCQKPEIAGKWFNPTAKIHDLSRLEIKYNCGERQLKSYDHLRNALWVVKAYSRCARTDCVWGRSEGINRQDGKLLATYNTFSAIRQLVIQKDGGLLKVDVRIVYRDQRPALETSHFLHPAQYQQLA